MTSKHIPRCGSCPAFDPSHQEINLNLGMSLKPYKFYCRRKGEYCVESADDIACEQRLNGLDVLPKGEHHA